MLAFLLIFLAFQGDDANRPGKEISSTLELEIARDKADGAGDVAKAEDEHARTDYYYCCLKRGGTEVTAPACDGDGCDLGTGFRVDVYDLHHVQKNNHECEIITSNHACIEGETTKCAESCKATMLGLTAYRQLVENEAFIARKNAETHLDTETQRAEREYKAEIEPTKSSYQHKLTEHTNAESVENTELAKYVKAFEKAKDTHNAAVDALAKFKVANTEAKAKKEQIVNAAQVHLKQKEEEHRQRIAEKGKTNSTKFPEQCKDDAGQEQDCCCNIGGAPVVVPHKSFKDWDVCVQPTAPNTQRYAKAPWHLWQCKTYFAECGLCKPLVCGNFCPTRG